MNNAVLTEVINRWEREAEPSEQVDTVAPDTDQERIRYAHRDGVIQGHRECKRECADLLRMLVDSIG